MASTLGYIMYIYNYTVTITGYDDYDYDYDMLSFYTFLLLQSGCTIKATIILSVFAIVVLVVVVAAMHTGIAPVNTIWSY